MWAESHHSKQMPSGVDGEDYRSLSEMPFPPRCFMYLPLVMPFFCALVANHMNFNGDGRPGGEKGLGMCEISLGEELVIFASG